MAGRDVRALCQQILHVHSPAATQKRMAEAVMCWRSGGKAALEAW